MQTIKIGAPPDGSKFSSLFTSRETKPILCRPMLPRNPFGIALLLLAGVLPAFAALREPVHPRRNVGALSQRPGP